MNEGKTYLIARLSLQYSLSPNSSADSSPKLLGGRSEATQRIIRPSSKSAAMSLVSSLNETSIRLTITSRSQDLAIWTPPNNIDCCCMPLESRKVRNPWRMRCDLLAIWCYICDDVWMDHPNLFGKSIHISCHYHTWAHSWVPPRTYSNILVCACCC
jgi:hypothetical protein